MSNIGVVVIVAAMLLAVAFWLDGRATRRDEQMMRILRGLQQPTWNGTYDTCPICGVMKPCVAHQPTDEPTEDDIVRPNAVNALFD